MYFSVLLWTLAVAKEEYFRGSHIPASKDEPRNLQSNHNNDGHCEDESTKCQTEIQFRLEKGWAPACNSPWIKQRCQKSCGICLHTQAPQPATTVYTTAPSTSCRDVLLSCPSNKNTCNHGGAVGEYMRANCMLTCGVCETTNTAATTPASTGLTGGKTGCTNASPSCPFNINIYINNCNATNEALKKWVRSRCMLSCGTCGRFLRRTQRTYILRRSKNDPKPQKSASLS